MIAGGRSTKAAFGNALKARRSHQAGDAMPPAGMPGFEEFCLNPQATIGSMTVCMDSHDFTYEHSILSYSCTVWSLSPRVVPARRYPQSPAHHLNGKGVAVTRYALNPRFDSWAKYAAASFKKSRSRFTWPSSRFNLASSSSCA